MKGWRMLLAIVIVSMFIMPVVPATKAAGEPNIPSPTRRGDLIFYECRGWWDIPGEVDHVSIWDKDRSKIIEADPYYDVWKDFRAPWPPYLKLRYLYPSSTKCLKYLTYKSYNNPGTTWGWVEQQTLQHDTIENPDRPYEKLWYYHVNGGNPATAISFARSKIGHPFDYYSPWERSGADSKQIDESEEEYMDYNGNSYNLGRGYYCSELVWAAWKKGGVDLDPDDDSVMPQEIIDENTVGNSPKIELYMTVTIPPP